MTKYTFSKAQALSESIAFYEKQISAIENNHIEISVALPQTVLLTVFTPSPAHPDASSFDRAAFVFVQSMLTAFKEGLAMCQKEFDEL